MICKINISTTLEKLRAFYNNININITIMMRIISILHEDNNNNNNGILGYETCTVHQLFLNSLHGTKGGRFSF